jgi:hypothetical protein
MKRSCLPFFLTALFVCCSITVAESSESDNLNKNPSDFSVKVRNSLLSVRASNLPLDRLMNEIMNQTSIIITMPAEDTKPLSAHFTDQPLDEGLKWLMRSYNTVFIYSAGNEHSQKISQIIIYPKDGESNNKGPRPNNPVAERPSGMSSADIMRPRQRVNTSNITDRNLLQRERSQGADENLAMDSSIAPLSRIVSNNEDGEDRLKAVQKLGDLEDENALIPLVSALHDDDPRVRKNAMDGLCRIGGKNVIRALEGCLEDQNDDVREIAAEALQKLKD